MTDFDVIVIGAGHAGCEAAWAASGMGARVGLMMMLLLVAGGSSLAILHFAELRSRWRVEASGKQKGEKRMKERNGGMQRHSRHFFVARYRMDYQHV
jgi:folate-dependent tRNA-U54 methylase TrmFO/GidA